MFKDKLIQGSVIRNEELSEKSTFKLAESQYKKVLDEDYDVPKGRFVKSEYIWVVSFVTKKSEEQWHENYRLDINNIIGGMVMIKGEHVTEEDVISALKANGFEMKELQIKQLFRRQTYKAIVHGTGVKYQGDGEYIIDSNATTIGK